MLTPTEQAICSVWQTLKDVEFSAESSLKERLAQCVVCHLRPALLSEELGAHLPAELKEMTSTWPGDTSQVAADEQAALLSAFMEAAASAVRKVPDSGCVLARLFLRRC